MSAVHSQQTLVIELAATGINALGTLRADGRRWEACDVDGVLWLRVAVDEQTLSDPRVLSILGQRFTIHEDGTQLVPLGHRVPTAILPKAEWIPLAQRLPVALPVPCFGGQAVDRVQVQLVRDCAQRDANVLLTDVSNWVTFAVTTSMVRLKRLTFAVGKDMRDLIQASSAVPGGDLVSMSAKADRRVVVIRGEPMPPIPGTPFVETEGIAVPAGWTWSPRLDASVLRAAYSVTARDLVLFSPIGGWDRIPADAFVPASRAAARRMQEEGA